MNRREKFPQRHPFPIALKGSTHHRRHGIHPLQRAALYLYRQPSGGDTGVAAVESEIPEEPLELDGIFSPECGLLLRITLTDKEPRKVTLRLVSLD
jgi:hypothetical protein